MLSPYRIALLGLFSAALLTQQTLANAEAAEAAVDSDVLVLTESNFNDAIRDNDLMMVEFYAPWCGHCKNLAPEYEKAATALKPKGISLAKVDCVAENELCSKHGVDGYPTLVTFRKGQVDGPKKYEKARKAQSIVSYLEKQQGSAVKSVSADDLEDVKVSDEVVVIGFFDSEDSESYKAFTEAAEKHRDDYTFASSTDSELAKGQGVEGSAVIIYHKTGEKGDPLVEKDVLIDVNALSRHIRVNSLPLVQDVGPENYASYEKAGLPLAFAFYSPKNENMREMVVELVTPAAKKLRGKINVVLIDGDKYGGSANNLNLKPEWPALGVEGNDRLKYPMDQSLEMTEESVESFLTDVAEGKAKPFLKSEPIPESNDASVKVVVGDEFEKLVMDPTKDVLIEFYAPWCGHCKKLAPIYEELGEKYAGHDSLIIAKMDATTNDIPVLAAEFDVTGFPTIKLVKRGTNDIVNYSGSRTLESFVEFLTEHVGPAPEKVEVEEKIEIVETVSDSEPSKVHAEL
ncbi:protein disulfide-isomerase precursor [Dispira simplex]|nr:protein disulfide-isomerase precursor [Dispira simplex]